MSTQKYFRLTREAALLAVISAAFPITGYCVSAGRADFVVGNVIAVAADGRQRPLSKGTEINAGDAISTAPDARAQIRFSDGGYISLQPNTQFRVDTYQYDGKADGKEKGFFSLLKGGLRAISGVIGHVNRESYQVATPAATIGIRGTGYNVMLGEGLSVSVSDGIITLTNKGGSLVIPQGQSAYVADENTSPALTFDKPATPPAALGSTVPISTTGYVAGDNTYSAITVSTGVYSVFSGTVLDGSSGANTTVSSDTPGIIAFNSQGSRLYYVQGQNPAGGLTDFTAATLATGISGTNTDTYASISNSAIPASGNDGTISWGRFYGDLTYSDPSGTWMTTFGPNQGVHSVVGIPTTIMPTSGNAHYTLTGATAPTLASGAVAPGTVSGGTLDVYFSGAPTLRGTLNLGIGGHDYNLYFSGSFSGNNFAYTNPTVGSGSGGCSGSCSASVSGFFAGANAASAGIAYGINGSTLGSTIGGAAVYSRTSLGAQPN